LAEGLKRLKALEHESEGAIVRRALRRYLEASGVMKTERKRAVTRRRPKTTAISLWWMPSGGRSHGPAVTLQ
jgi:hypothetical protein